MISTNPKFFRYLACGVCAILFIFFAIQKIVFDFESKDTTLSASSTERNSGSGVDSEKNIILFWTKYFSWDNPHLHDDMAQCPEKRCIGTDDRSLLPRSSAVVFHARNMNPWDLPPTRQPQQKFVFFSNESPYQSYVDLREDPWINYFNLTWTYRLDSDIVSGAYFVPKFYNVKVWTDRVKQRDVLSKKLNRAVTIISHCDALSNRDVYISRLQTYFPVDVFGRCGDTLYRQCLDCAKKIPDYKFQLAFENGICKDYVTEKATRAFTTEVVPIVFGGANYSTIFPPHSFINTADFDSPRQLAEHLWKLVNNSSLYEEYFQWKYNEKYVGLPEQFQPANTDVCKLCQILHDEQHSRKSFSYEDLDEWWTTKSKCVVPLVSYPGLPLMLVLFVVSATCLLVVLLSNLVYFCYRYRVNVHRKRLGL